jgi:molybdopterin/thiamine biosynthesis adenylyltransferase
MNTERYARHALIDWFDQERIKRERIVVVGAGAVGNEVIKNLALLGIGELHVFDRDLIEVHNLTRSVLFRDSDIGKPKAVCAADRARELDASVIVAPHVGDFWSTLRLTDVQAASAVFCCVDNFEARIRLNRLCAIAGTPFVNVGIDSRFVVVEHFPFRTEWVAPCYECALPPSAYAAMATRYSCGWLRRIAGAERKIPTTIITASAAGALAVSVYLRSLSAPDAASAFRYFQDSFNGIATRTEIGRTDGCAGCADLLPARVVVTAPRSATSALAALDAVAVGPLLFSDRVLTHIACPTCEPGNPGTLVFERADAHDETLMLCPTCNERSRTIRIQEEFSLGELRERYAGCHLPGKFVTATVNGDLQVFVELEGDIDARRASNTENGRPDAQSGSDAAA